MIIDLEANYGSPSLEDSPPPYLLPKDVSVASSSPSRGSPDHPLPTLPSVSSPIKDSKTVKHIYLPKRDQNISGTYSIDPSLPGQALEVWSQKSKDPLPHALFRTRRGKVTLNLATCGRSTDLAKKVNVRVRTDSGDININLFQAPSPRHISLDVHSRKGDVTLLVPRTFSGVVQMRTKRGNLKFLPVFAKQMRILMAKDDEALILFGENNFSNDPLHHDTGAADYCQLSSRSGVVTVGIVGEDVDRSEPGLWKRMVQSLAV